MSLHLGLKPNVASTNFQYQRRGETNYRSFKYEKMGGCLTNNSLLTSCISFRFICVATGAQRPSQVTVINKYFLGRSFLFLLKLIKEMTAYQIMCSVEQFLTMLEEEDMSAVNLQALTFLDCYCLDFLYYCCTDTD